MFKCWGNLWGTLGETIQLTGRFRLRAVLKPSVKEGEMKAPSALQYVFRPRGPLSGFPPSRKNNRGLRIGCNFYVTATSANTFSMYQNYTAETMVMLVSYENSYLLSKHQILILWLISKQGICFYVVTQLDKKFHCYTWARTLEFCSSVAQKWFLIKV